MEHWLFTPLARDRAASRLPASAGEPNERQKRPGWVSTLLGPEEAAASLRADTSNGLAIENFRMGVLDTWFRPYLENYTVDASIFWTGSLWDPSLLQFACSACSVKFLRAYGGCLGTRSR